MTLEKILTDLARAIESAAAAPLLERIAGLERQLEQAKKERDAFEVLASEFIKLAAKLDPVGAAGFMKTIQSKEKP
jgi:HPt (histidine-containing phosphotransfer) domain-containing protein